MYRLQEAILMWQLNSSYSALLEYRSGTQVLADANLSWRERLATAPEIPPHSAKSSTLGQEQLLV